MKQSQLTFRTKRTAVASTKGGKPTASKVTAPSPEVSSSSSAISIDVSDDSDLEPATVKAKKKALLEHAVKKQKLDDGTGKAKIFKTRQSIENIPAGVNDEENTPVAPQLNPRDKRWNELYGKAREKTGNIEIIHASQQNKIHHILRIFDLSYEYGPCVGVTRLERWERAEALGLNPPVEIKEILTTQQGKEKDEFAYSVFHGEEV